MALACSGGGGGEMMEGRSNETNNNQNYLNSAMAIEAEAGGGGGSNQKMKWPRRRTENAKEWDEYEMKVRATTAILKIRAAERRADRFKRMNMTTKQRIQQDLFFSPDIDLNRIKVSDTPRRWGLVSDKQMMQPAPAGGATSSVPCFPNKD